MQKPLWQWAVIVLIWSLLLLGAITNLGLVQILGTIAADFFAAWLLYSIAQSTPKAWQQSMFGFALGMLVIGLSDLAVLAGLGASLEPPLSVLGTLLFFLASVALPFLLERQGVYKNGFALQISLIALAVAVLLSALLTILFQPPILRIVYQTVGLFLSSLFIMQSQDFAGGTIGRVLRMLSIAFAVSSFSQVVFAVLPGVLLEPGNLPDLARQTFWSAGITLLSFVPQKR
jgi:hypothetical protein